MDSMIWNKKLDKEFITVVGVDHPLSLGYEFKLVTTSPYAHKTHRIDQAKMELMMPKSFAHCEGLHAVWNNPIRRVVIVINFSSTKAWSKKRVIELLVHELSHAVDDVFERCLIKSVDTELRAYTIDWLVGKYVCCFPEIGK